MVHASYASDALGQRHAGVDEPAQPARVVADRRRLGGHSTYSMPHRTQRERAESRQQRPFTAITADPIDRCVLLPTLDPRSSSTSPFESNSWNDLFRSCV